MSLQLIHLRKLLKICYLTDNRQISAIRAEIRMDISKETGMSSGGGDFHTPFWSDAKKHVFDTEDLYSAVELRVESNDSRERLYPRLRDGFLKWWDERRRWTNAPFRQVEAPHARFDFEGATTIKVENFLSVQDAADNFHYIYPYFSEAPVLSNEAARLGLWVLKESLPDYSPDDLRILDVLRGNSFGLDRYPLVGNEKDVLIQRFNSINSIYHKLRKEY